jgi:hypothetical protein
VDEFIFSFTHTMVIDWLYVPTLLLLLLCPFSHPLLHMLFLSRSCPTHFILSVFQAFLQPKSLSAFHSPPSSTSAATVCITNIYPGIRLLSSARLVFFLNTYLFHILFLMGGCQLKARGSNIDFPRLAQILVLRWLMRKVLLVMGY